MTNQSDSIIFWAIAGARLLVPVAIPRFPLPAILVCLVLDAVDQTLFQQFTDLSLDNYQGYDKALDIYYLAVAYVSTLRNWSNRLAVWVSRFLFYGRLAGVALFELTHLRWLLLLFPNVFEYFFVFYEAYRLRWDPARMSKRFAIGAALAIWVVVKLPQEYWIHIAQLDTTEWVKTVLLGLPAGVSWAETIGARPVICLGSLGLLASFLLATWLLARRRLPAADWAVAFSADAHQPVFTAEQMRQAVSDEAETILDVAWGEKVVLLALLCLCFAQVLPEVRATSLQLSVGVAALVTTNTAISHWQARRGTGWPFRRRQFILLALVNSGLILAYGFVRGRLDAPVRVGNALFFALMLALLVTLYDHYRQVCLMRFRPQGM